MNARRYAVKTVLWAIMGVLAVVTAVRFFKGLGATTSLTDVTPWGFWIAFDVMAGVALAAGGFTLAATFYIFHRESYHPFVRPAILTAFLGYAAVAVGLMYDLGLPWHIWHPIVFPQFHSVLFEVAMCVMLYLTVLTLEFSPAVLEHPWFDRPLFRTIHALLKKFTIPLVIAGIVLSTLHQSSLGSLFLIAPYRVHPLWYSKIIYVLFLTSAIGLGLMMVIGESFFSHWLFGHKLRMPQLAGLGRAASIVLFLYAFLRIGDLAARGVLGYAFDGSWQGNLFIFEMLLSAVVPAAFLLFRRVRESAAGLAASAAMAIFGIVGYRFDVCIVAFTRPDSMPYFPRWTEVAVSAGIVAGAMLVFIFFVERLKVYPEDHDEESGGKAKIKAYPGCDPGTVRMLLPLPIAAHRVYSIAFVAAAALAVGFLSGDAQSAAQAPKTPVAAARSLDGIIGPHAPDKLRDIRLAPADEAIPEGTQRTTLLIVNGNDDERLVLFPHDVHVAKLGEKASCAKCHHENIPYDKNSACWKCHRDMYGMTDIFDHSSHVKKLGDEESCVRCHQDGPVKNRGAATPCADCHKDMAVEGAAVEPRGGTLKGYAAGYMDAMHGLCIGCHQRMVKESPNDFGLNFARCPACHRDFDAELLHRTGPYSHARRPE